MLHMRHLSATSHFLENKTKREFWIEKGDVMDSIRRLTAFALSLQFPWHSHCADLSWCFSNHFCFTSLPAKWHCKHSYDLVLAVALCKRSHRLLPMTGDFIPMTHDLAQSNTVRYWNAYLLLSHLPTPIVIFFYQSFAQIQYTAVFNNFFPVTTRLTSSFFFKNSTLFLL